MDALVQSLFPRRQNPFLTGPLYYAKAPEWKGWDLGTQRRALSLSVWPLGRVKASVKHLVTFGVDLSPSPSFYYTYSFQGVNPCSAYAPLGRFHRVNVIHSDSVVMTSACISFVKRQSGIQLQGFGLSTLQALGLRFCLWRPELAQPVRIRCPAHLPNPHPQPHVGRQGGSPPWPGFSRAH